MRTSASRADRWLLAISTIIFLVVCVVALRTLTSRPSSETLPPVIDEQIAASSTVLANLTQIPQSAPLSGPLITDLDEIETLIAACADYSAERRSQSAQHIAWLREPSTIPEQMIIALGSTPTAGLLRGLATYTLSDWGLKDQAPDSCLLPIGRRINALLVAEGGESIAVFEE